MVRAQSLSLAVLVLGLHFLPTGRARWLLPLSFFTSGCTMDSSFALSAVYGLAVLLVERRLEVRPLFYSTAAVLLGLLVNPYFPYDVIFAFRHILPKLGDATAVDVGNEWYPYRTATVLSFAGAVAFLSGALALGLQEKRIDTRTAAAFFAAVLFGWMFFQSRRFVEYFPAFSLIFAALAWAQLLDASRQGKDDVSSAENRARQSWFRRPALYGWMPVVALVLLFIPGMWISVRGARQSMLNAQPSTRYALRLLACSEYAPGSLQTDWDDRAVLHDTHNTYLVGLTQPIFSFGRRNTNAGGYRRQG
jgi:hypothetical protein